MSERGNFSFLMTHDTMLARLGAQAEANFRSDPPTCLFKLRQFIEIMVRLLSARHGAYAGDKEVLQQTLARLSYDRVLPRDVADLFHALRKAGNHAVHGGVGNHGDALVGLKVAYRLAVWFHRTYGNDLEFKPGPFQPPPEPVDATAALKAEIAELRTRMLATEEAAAGARREAEEHARALETAGEQLRREAEERTGLELTTREAEVATAELMQRLAELQATAEQTPPQVAFALVQQAEAAAERIDLDEADTRRLIDQQLRDRGWEVDTPTFRYAAGTRPVGNRNLAIAEWPTASGPADYALFAGKTLVGVVEAKRRRRNVSAAIDQAERYSVGLADAGGGTFAGGPWGDHRVPFVFAANGRGYLKQLETVSGIWFRDTRRPSNLRRAMVDWPTPEGMLERLQVDQDAATNALRTQPFDFGFPLRPYQRQAIEAVEAALAADRRSMLVAMATGTGKTKLAIALLYRLLAAKRFRRICFVVDRSALGHQTEGEFTTTKVVSGKTFAEIFGLKGLGDITPESDTRVHICTIQGLVRRVLYQPDTAAAPPVDQYDLIVVDECHRGYLLDREMSDAELSFRGQDDYISKYRRVLDYFDAVKIGLTATPALHTTDIFGAPIFTYSYRDAVIDGYLIDHEPPIRIETALSRSGIGFSRGDAVDYIATNTGEVQSVVLPDEISFEIEQFNKQVITEAFNTVVAEELARQIDPALPGKTLVFAATDAHADIVVQALKQALQNTYGGIDDGAVRKITGKVDQVQTLIRSYRNDAYPRVAVTVDLLTTGIDVPSIVNLVFLRRVNSRILYEQMIGRATRLCPDIGKEVFRIFDAVDLYPHLQDLTDMKPVVVNPSISFEQLISELLGVQDQGHRQAIMEQLAVKLRRRLGKLTTEAQSRYEALAGETPQDTLQRLLKGPPDDVAAWMRDRRGIGPVLDWQADGVTPRFIPISDHPDKLEGITRGYGTATKPEDFLKGFQEFVRGNINRIAALKLVVQRPRDLTRADLKALRQALDLAGYSEANLRRAWADATNEEIATSVIGFVRQAAIGDALVPFEDRVRAAMRRILASRPWTGPQKQWLQRIGEQVVKEVVVDRGAIDDEPFSNDGGFTRLNKVFSGELERILAGINEEVWKEAG